MDESVKIKQREYYERPQINQEDKKIVFACSVGTVFEWYDFYLYGALASLIGDLFFTNFDDTIKNIFTLLAFAVGFVVRPLGALFFGRLGDVIGRKYTFLATVTIMGASTFLVGFLPTATDVGIWSPIFLIILRLLQGLALGGEYGGAATYVAEHAPHGRRGYYTGWIQVTIAIGLFLSLVVILIVRTIVGEEAFLSWGWRIPFLLSIILLGISIWIRLNLQESPAFLKMKELGTHSKSPIRETFGTWKNAKIIFLALFGLVAGQAVVLYTGQFYVLFFLESVLSVDSYTASILLAWALLIGSFGFVFFGWLSDRVGRKVVILGGCVLAAFSYFPIFHMITGYANPALRRAQVSIRVVVLADPADCSFQLRPVDISHHNWQSKSCDILKAALAARSVVYQLEPQPAGTIASVQIGGNVVNSYDAAKAGENEPEFARDLSNSLNKLLASVGYPSVNNTSIVVMKHPFDIFRIQVIVLIFLLTSLILYIAMVYGPIAAALVELFPTRIRYTALSVPYHVGNGWFGGLLPAIIFAINAGTGDIYAGLWYPVVVALGTAMLGYVALPETNERDIFAEDST